MESSGKFNSQYPRLTKDVARRMIKEREKLGKKTDLFVYYDNDNQCYQLPIKEFIAMLPDK